jgi:hypothetical protein
VFLLDIYGKNQRDNISKAARNHLAETLPQVASAYRASQAAAAVEMKKKGTKP